MTTVPEDSATQLTAELVQLASTPDHDQRAAIARCAERLRAAGFEVEVTRDADRSDNLVARWGEGGGNGGLCFTGHLDTVPVRPDEWSFDPHSGTVSEGRLLGRGSADMKAGVAATICAAESYVNCGGPGPLSVVLTGREEVGSLGASRLADQGLLPPASALVVTEPTDNEPRLGHRGAVWFDIVSRGRACHASTPQLGVNAIDALVDCLADVRAWHTEHPDEDPLLGARTMSVGRVSGGTQRNIGPDLARAEVDVRTGNPDDVVELVSRIQAVLGDRAEAVSALTLSPVRSDPDSVVARLARTIWTGAQQDAGSPGGPELAPVARFFTDASVLTPAMGGLPTLIWGPGSPDQAHTVDEYCEVGQIERATQMFAALLRAQDEGELPLTAGAGSA